MTKRKILDFLLKNKDKYLKKYHLSKLALFGSCARDEATENSDIDILYETASKGLTFSQVTEFEDELHRYFGKEIDLVDFAYMNPLIKRKALKEIIYV